MISRPSLGSEYGQTLVNGFLRSSSQAQSADNRLHSLLRVVGIAGAGRACAAGIETEHRVDAHEHARQVGVGEKAIGRPVRTGRLRGLRIARIQDCPAPRQANLSGARTAVRPDQAPRQTSFGSLPCTWLPEIERDARLVVEVGAEANFGPSAAGVGPARV